MICEAVVRSCSKTLSVLRFCVKAITDHVQLDVEITRFSRERARLALQEAQSRARFPVTELLSIIC